MFILKKIIGQLFLPCTVMFGNIDRGIAAASVYAETKGRKDYYYRWSNFVYTPELSCSFEYIP